MFWVGDTVMNISEGLTLSGCSEKSGDSWIDNRREGSGRFK